jgi:hypothetical protein
MFCYVFKLFDRTGISLHDSEKCLVTCPDYDLNLCKCKIGVTRNETLSKDKFGWLIEDHIVFTVPKESKSKMTKYISAISLIHPSESDVWIVFSQRHSKKDNDWSSIYRFYQNNEMKEFDTLTALNIFLKKSGYNGRKLEESDFLLKKE